MRLISLWFLALLLLLASWVVYRSPERFSTQNRDDVAAASSTVHPAGTDELGRDRASRIALALILTLGGACAASVTSAAIALSLGAWSASAPRWLGAALLYSTDLFLTLPWLFLLMLVRAALPLNLAPLRSEAVTFLLLAVLGAPVFLRVNHEKTKGLLQADWVLQGRAAGLRFQQRIEQLWPHLRPLLWTQFLLYVPACVIAEANLGTMGLGLSEPLPSLGTFLSNLQSEALTGGSRLVFLPVVILILALVALEMTVFGAES